MVDHVIFEIGNVRTDFQTLDACNPVDGHAQIIADTGFEADQGELIATDRQSSANACAACGVGAIVVNHEFVLT